MRRIATLLFLLSPLAAGCAGDEPIQRPSPLFTGSPFEYPVELWDQGIEGETVLLIHITAMGDVDSVTVHRSSGYRQFDSAAVAGARGLRFTPGRRGDKRIRMWARLPVRFTRADGAAAGAMEAVQ
ncbi:MAG TPA: energy transducer TonB [Longimicrobiales bacterium]